MNRDWRSIVERLHGAARRKARQQAQKAGHQISKGTLAADDWVILVTSLAPQDIPSADVLVAQFSPPS